MGFQRGERKMNIIDYRDILEKKLNILHIDFGLFFFNKRKFKNTSQPLWDPREYNESRPLEYKFVPIQCILPKPSAISGPYVDLN